MVDLIIPSVLKIWLIFLLVFFFLGYPVQFSILFGAIGGLAGGLCTAWWEIEEEKSSPITEKLSESEDGDKDDSAGPRWDLPFLGPSKAKQRYIERNKRSRDRKIR